MTITAKILLSAIVLLALFLPFLVHKVERNLEVFLFVLGLAAVTVTGLWSPHLIWEAVKEPVGISLAVLITGVLFSLFKEKIINVFIGRIQKKLGLKYTIMVIVFGLSVLSSVITAIIAALVLCEFTAVLKLSRRDTMRVIVMGCFAIGIGAILTPLGEPLSTIVTSKLAHPPHNADFFFLLRAFWAYVLPGLIVFSWLAARIKDEQKQSETVLETEGFKDIVLRASKVFLFVAALVFLGTGLTPIAEITILKFPTWALYWANSISAILDNATLAAAEIVPAMSMRQIEFLLIALTISGGLLIPGNIPNIICAGKFRITSREWAKESLIPAAAAMTVYFVILSIVSALKG